MSKIKIIDYSSEADINSIFERKIELGAVIQFNLLQTVLEEFIKRQKKMSDKIAQLEFKLSKIQISGNKENRESKDYELSQKETIETNDKPIIRSIAGFDKNKENEIFTNKEKQMIKDDGGDNKKINITYEKRVVIVDDKTNVEKEEKEKEETETEKEKELYTRIKKIESNCNFLMDYIKKNNFNELKMQTGRVQKYHENKINELFRKINVISEFDNIKEENKPNFDYFEIPNEKMNSLEQKLSERIEDLEKKTKLNDDSIYSIKRDIVVIKNLNDNLSKLSHTNQDSIENLIKDMDTKIKTLNSKIDDETEKLKDLSDKNYRDNKNVINKNYNELNDKLDKIINDIEAINKKKSPNLIGADKLNEINNDLKEYMNKSMSDTENYLKSMVNNLDDKIKKDLSNINEEIKQNKLLKKDLELLNMKITDVIEKKIIDLSQKVDAQSTDINLCNDTCNKTVKMVEYLSGQLPQNSPADTENSNKIDYIDLKQNVEMSSYMTKDLFKEEKNKILKKIEKTLEIEGENYMFIKKIEERLKFFTSENDLRNMEQCFINLLEEFKLYLSKKYLDKNEANKTFKYIDLQLRQIIENGNFNNKDGENWLIAKKPINSYVCASCETYLGELKNKNIFLPWNKIPLRDEKKYRMGHGFSKMLQLLNSDILKNAELVSETKNSDKKTEEYKKLPKIKSQPYIHNQNNTYSLIQNNDSGDHAEYELNNSADNLEQISNERKIIENKKKMSTSCYGKTSEKVKEKYKNNNQTRTQTNSNNLATTNINTTSITQDPKILKIIKKNRK